jgi:hypothetical protein
MIIALPLGPDSWSNKFRNCTLHSYSMVFTLLSLHISLHLLSVLCYLYRDEYCAHRDTIWNFVFEQLAYITCNFIIHSHFVILYLGAFWVVSGGGFSIFCSSLDVVILVTSSIIYVFVVSFEVLSSFC